MIEVLKEFEDIRGGRPVDNQEFAAAQDGLLKGFASQFETQSQTVSQMARILMFGLPDNYYTSLEAQYKDLTVDDINRVAGTHIQNNQLMLLVVGDRDVIGSDLEELGHPIVHVDHHGAELRGS